MRVLGVDPGLASTGWALVDSGEPLRLLGSGLISTPAGLGLGPRLRSLHEQVLARLDEHRPDAVALEQMFFARSTRSMAGTSQARGVIVLAAELRGRPLAEYNPTDVKTSLTGSGSAPKAQIQRMTRMLLGLEAELKPDHLADAAALALCHVRSERFRSRIVR